MASAGCETFDGGATGSATTAAFPVEIVSDPPGAKIEINNDYVGTTPMTVKLEGWEATRTFARRHIIVAHPVLPGQHTQIKMFSGWSEPSRTYGDTIPTKIFFNMNLIRTPKEYDIRIK